MADHVHALAEGFRLDQYEFQGVLSSSEAGIKYFCLDHEVGRRFAVMECLPSALVTRQVGGGVVPQSSTAERTFNELLEQFLREADAAAQFRHPSMVSVHGSLRANGTGYVLMDYVEGETLSALLARTGAIAVGSLMSLASPLMDCVAAMHEAHLLHLDIRPGNVVLGAERNPVLLTYGLGRHSARGARQALGEDRRRPRMTVPRSLYSAFEMYSKIGRVGPWTDIYALGATFYQCVAGRPPSAAPDRMMQDDFAALSDHYKDSANIAVLAAIDEALGMYVDDRPESIETWREALSGKPARPRRDRIQGGGVRIAARGPVRSGEIRTSKGASKKGGLRWAVPALALTAATAVISYVDTQVLPTPNDGRDAIARVEGVDHSPQLENQQVAKEPEDTGAGVVVADSTDPDADIGGTRLADPSVEKGTVQIATEALTRDESRPDARLVVDGEGVAVAVGDVGDDERVATGAVDTVGDSPTESEGMDESDSPTIERSVVADTGDVPAEERTLTGRQQAHVLAGSYGTLTLDLGPEDATVTIPGAEGGYTPRMKLPEGHHHLQVSRAGYRTAATRVHIAGDTRIRVALERESLCELRVLGQPPGGRYPARGTVRGQQSIGSASMFVTFTVDDDGTVLNEGLRVDSKRSQVEFPKHFTRFAGAATETVLQYRFAFEEPDDGTCMRRQRISLVIHFRAPSRV